MTAINCLHSIIEIITETREIALGASGGDVNTVEETYQMGRCVDCGRPMPIPDEVERMLEQ
jgi:hypothetical protein